LLLLLLFVPHTQSDRTVHSTLVDLVFTGTGDLRLGAQKEPVDHVEEMDVCFDTVGWRWYEFGF